MGIEWRNVRVSNRTPAPYEKITITGELWLIGPWPFPDRPAVDNEVTLTIDDYELGRERTSETGSFSFTIGAPPVPGPYTYVLTRTDPFWPGDPHHLVGTEVISDGDEEKKLEWQKYLVLGIIVLEVGLGAWFLRRRIKS